MPPKLKLPKITPSTNIMAYFSRAKKTENAPVSEDNAVSAVSTDEETTARRSHSHAAPLLEPILLQTENQTLIPFSKPFGSLPFKNTAKVGPLTVCDFELYFDGCSKGNPGKGGAGAVIYHNQEEIWSNYAFLGDNVTNNYAEYQGLLMGLNAALNLNIKNLAVYGDSKLVINQLNGTFQVKAGNLVECYNNAALIKNKLNYVTFKHVYRTENKRADKLANLGVELH
jgi:ribonuclease HI